MKTKPYRLQDRPWPDLRIHGIAVDNHTIAIGVPMLRHMLVGWYEPGYGRGDMRAFRDDGGSVSPEERE